MKPATGALAWAWIFAMLTGVAAAEVPPRTFAGQTLEVPEAELDQGQVYYVTPGEDAQLLAVSRAPLQRFAATASRIVGYFVSPFELEEGQSPILAGAFRLPLAAVDTGVEGGDRRLESAAFFDRENHPEITFQIRSVEDVQQKKRTPEESAYELTLAGELTVKGQKIPLSLPARLRLLPFSPRTMARYVGDLAFLETSFEIRPGDYGWQPPSPVFKERIGEEIRVDLFLTLNTITPDKSGDPRDDPAVYAKQQRVLTLLRDLDDPAAGYEFVRGFLDEIWDDAKELDRLADSIAFAEGISTRDNWLALRAATRASGLSEDKDPERLQTLARICHQMGDLKAAVEWQRKAVAAASEDAAAGEALSRYEQALRKRETPD